MKRLPRLAGLGLLAANLILRSGFYPQAAAAQSETQTPTPAKLSEQQERGRGRFLQRCALCHLEKIQKPKNVPAIGPPLTGVLQNAAPGREAAVRNQILRGTPNMPAFQYGLEPQDIDDLLAYLKIL